MMQRLGPCPQNCPNRYANENETCHSTCQRYMRYKLTKLLESKQLACETIMMCARSAQKKLKPLSKAKRRN